MKKTTVLIDPPRRRRFPEEFKDRVLAELLEPDTTVAEVARRFEISQSLVHFWRRQRREAESTKPAQVVSDFACFAREKSELASPFLRAMRIRLPTGILIEWSEPVSMEMVAELSKKLGGLS